MQENNGDAASAVVATGAAGHGGSPPPPPPAVDAVGFPLLADLGDPMEEIPAFEEVVSDEYSKVLP